jgi:threonine dehydrogenase-like Zn-dependent dehydrogenase
VKALCWTGVNKTAVETVPDPTLLNSHDIILKVRLSSVCGSDLHLLGGYVPAMRDGDILGHEFMGEVAEVGPAVKKHKVGDRVVVCSFISCGKCWYCQNGQTSLCDNGNPNPAIAEAAWGSSLGGCYGYSHALGGFAGSHADYIRVPYADFGAFPVPDAVDDTTALFASDALPTGWMAADLAGIEPGDTVAFWGAGGVGQMAARSAMLLGAERVIVIDRFPERLDMVTRHVGAETIDYTTTSVAEELRERTGGRGPDRCIEAVGMEAHSDGPEYLYDKAKQSLRLESDRPIAVRQAIHACRKGGTVSIIGVFGGLVDKFPLGAVMNRQLTIRSGQQNGHVYIPMLLDRLSKGEIDTAHLATHPMPLDQGPQGYTMFKEKADGCVRAVFSPVG